MIRIFTIFKSSIFTTALEPFLRSNGIEIISSCNNSALALDYFKVINPDIVMMDLNWSVGTYSISGESLIQQIQQHEPGVRIIAVTNFFDAQTVSRLKAQSVQGYFYRCMDNLLAEVKDCIERVYEGEGFYANTDASSLKTTTKLY